jgi:hypothetical protein
VQDRVGHEFVNDEDDVDVFRIGLGYLGQRRLGEPSRVPHVFGGGAQGTARCGGGLVGGHRSPIGEDRQVWGSSGTALGHIELLSELNSLLRDMG